MFQSPEYSNTLSLKLSEVLEDVGVNEEIVMKRRRAFMLVENIYTVLCRSGGDIETVYCFGSQSEGTTTTGLHSDIDSLYVKYNSNVIQDWSEWKQNQFNLLIIKDENVTPGYCFLQLLRSDEPLFETIIPDEDYIRDSKGRVLMKNTFFICIDGDFVRHGPSNALTGREGYSDSDVVFGYPCSSLPQSALYSLNRHSIGRWPTSEMIRYAVSNGCFVVVVSSKISKIREINCVPRELQYEMIRSTQDDMQQRSIKEEKWMNFAVVDSLPFLYFLQYKAYGHLQRHQDQQRALCNLVITTMSCKNLGHRETALNIIGQCMEQENKPMAAMRCYMLSLQQREKKQRRKIPYL